MRLKRRHPSKLKRRIPEFVELPEDSTEMRYHDIITVKGTPEAVDNLSLRYSLGVIPTPAEKDTLKDELITQEVGMAEMLITPNSALVG